MVKFFGYQRNKLRKINYKNNNIRNKKENKKLLNKKIKDFLCENEISNKYKNPDKNQNKKNLKILEKYENLEKNNKNESNFFECLEMTIETFYKEIFLKKYFEEFIRKEKKKNDDNYIQKLRECSENFIEYYNNDENDENENKTYLSKKRNNKPMFIIHKDN